MSKKKYGYLRYNSYRIDNAIVEYVLADPKRLKERGYHHRFVEKAKRGKVAWVKEWIIRPESTTPEHYFLEEKFEEIKKISNTSDWVKINEQSLTIIANDILTPITKREKEDLVQEYNKYLKRQERLRQAREAYKQDKEERRVKRLIRKAKKTGEPQLLERYSIPCREKSEECNVDNVYIYITKKGKKIEKIYHTY